MIATLLRTRRHPDSLSAILEDHYIEYSRIKPKTIARYRCELRRWQRLTGNPPIRHITTDHFLSFRRKCLDSGLSPSSIEGSIKIVNVLLRFARDRGWLKALPLSGKPIPIIIEEPEPASLDELSRLYRAADEANWPGRKCVAPRDWMKAFIVLQYWTGIRAENLLWRLQWSHVRKDHIRFRQTKTSKAQTYPLVPIVESHLRLVHGMDPDRVLAVKNLQRINIELARLCDIASIRKLTTSHIREACFTQWFAADETAGKLIHGCGIPKVLRRHYLGRLQILQEAAPKVKWPEGILNSHQ